MISIRAKFTILLLGLFVLLFIGCSTLKGNDMQNRKETQILSMNTCEWFCEPDSDTGYKKETLSIFQILNDKEQYAIKQLDSQSFVQIDEELAEKLIGKKIENIDNLILARGVAYNKNFTDFTILTDGENLFIIHMSLGHSEEIVKFPIIINVKHIPNKVFSACGQVS